MTERPTDYRELEGFEGKDVRRKKREKRGGLLILLVGVAAIAIGIAFIYWPAGVIVGGVLLALIGAIVWASGDEDDAERAWASNVEDKAED